MPRKNAHAYAVHPSVEMVQGWIGTLKAKTGKSLEEWCAFIRKSGPKTEEAARDWLKKEHDLGTNTAWWLAERAHATPGQKFDDDPETYLELAPKYVEDQYAGKKAALKPVYESLLALGLSMGKSAKACPCKTFVPLFRNHVFAQIKPSTNTRIDFGLALAKCPDSKIAKAGERLIDTGGKAKKDRITHRIAITTPDEIDAFVERWLKTAYELDA